MPLYPMICPDCGKTTNLIAGMVDPHQFQCPCGTMMERDWSEMSFHASPDSYSQDIHSDALAISPSQVAEHKQHFPDIQLDSECRPVFTNYKQHNAYLEKTGFTKKRQKVRHSIRDRNPRKATPK